MKNFIIYITGNSAGYLNDYFCSLVLPETVQNTLKHNMKEQFNFRKTTIENQNISVDSAE